jgi:hypothetical protein
LLHAKLSILLAGGGQGGEDKIFNPLRSEKAEQFINITAMR